MTLKIASNRYLTHTAASSTEKNVEANDMTINEYYSYSRNLSVLYYDGKPVKLNKKQSKLIEILAQNINHTVKYDILISQLWEDESVADSTLRTLVYSIRKLLPDLPIVSHSKIGYSLEIIH